MDIKDKAKYLCRLVMEAVKNDKDVEKTIEAGLKELERAEAGFSGQSGV